MDTICALHKVKMFPSLPPKELLVNSENTVLLDIRILFLIQNECLETNSTQWQFDDIALKPQNCKSGNHKPDFLWEA